MHIPCEPWPFHFQDYTHILAHVQNKVCTSILTALLIVMTKGQTQPKCTSKGNRINKLQYTCKTEIVFQLAIKSDAAVTKDYKLYDFTYMKCPEQGNLQKQKDQWLPETGDIVEKWRVSANSYRVSLGMMRMFQNVLWW